MYKRQPGVERYVVNGGGLTGIQILPDDEIEIINNDIKPNSISPTLESNPLKILIAGCGTGQQIIMAQRYRNAQITAIDISNSSLSYAQRKINELGIKM